MVKHKFGFGIVVILLLLMTVGSALAVPAGGSSYWNFNGNAYDSWGSNDLTVNGATQSGTVPTFNISGDGGTNSYEFDGNDDYLLKESFTSIAKDRTVSLWYKRDNTNKNAFLEFRKTGDNVGYLLSYNDNDYETIRNFMYDGSTAETATYLIADTTSWHHLVSTYDGANLKLYVDGILRDTEPATITPLVSDKLYIGNIDGLTMDYDGLIDEVKIWNRSLNITEIQNVFNYNDITGAPATPSNMQIYANNSVTSSGITTYNATVTGVGLFSTTNGTINTNVSSGTYTIEVCADGYACNITVGHDATTDLYANLLNSTVYWNVSFPAITNLENNGTHYLTFNLSNYVVNPDADTVTYTISAETVSEVNCDIYNLTYINYTMAEDYSGNATCTIRATDASGSSDQILNIEVLNVNMSITWDSPSTTPTQYNQTFIELSYNITDDWVNQANCTVLDTNSTNYGSFIYNTGTTNNKINITLNDVGNFSVYLECNDTSNVLNDFNSTITVIHIDSVLPTIVTNYVNNGIYLFKNFTAQFNFSDSYYLHSYNVSIDGIEQCGQNGINGTTASCLLNVTTLDWSVDGHTITVRVADGHTSEKLKGDYKWKNGLFNDYLEYEVYNGNKIRMEGLPDSWFDEFTTTKHEDRYKFKYKPNTKLTEYSFDVFSEIDKIYVVNDPDGKKKYGGQWAIIGNHWLDYAVDGYDTTTSIEQINDYQIRVTVSGLPDTLEEIEFSSIGDLNIVTNTYYFTRENYSVTYESEVIEGQTQSIVLNVTKNGAVPLVCAGGCDPGEYNPGASSTSATLYYNGWTLAPTTSVTSGLVYDLHTFTFLTNKTSNNVSEDREFYFDVRFSEIQENNTYAENTTNETQTIYKINLQNCADNASWAEALKIFSIDEISNVNLDNLSVNVNFDIWFSSTGNERNVSFEFRDLNNYSLCIFPTWTTYKVDATIEYQEQENALNQTYAHRKYFLWNYTLNNNTRTVNLYNIVDTLPSDIILKVYDKVTGENVPDAFVKILRYYPGENTYRTVEIEKTDARGQTLAKMQLADVFYKFIVEQYGTVIFASTSVEKILSTTKLIPASISDDVLLSFSLYDNVVYNVSCTKSTQTCRYTWSDVNNLVQNATLKVYRKNAYGRTLLYNHTTTAVAGSMVYVITENITGNNYVAEGFIHTNTKFSIYKLGEGFIVDSTDFESWGGLQNLFPGMLLMISLICAFLDFGAIGVIIGSLVGLILLSAIGLIPITWSAIVTFIILGGLLMAKIKQ